MSVGRHSTTISSNVISPYRILSTPNVGHVKTVFSNSRKRFDYRPLIAIGNIDGSSEYIATASADTTAVKTDLDSIGQTFAELTIGSFTESCTESSGDHQLQRRLH